MNIPVNSRIKRQGSTEGGRIGGFFRLAAGGETYGVSCNHVIADYNACRVGDILVDDAEQTVGMLTHWLQLETGMVNGAELALFKLDQSCNGVWSVTDNYLPQGFAYPALNATANFTADGSTKTGTVTDLDHKTSIVHGGREYRFGCVRVTSSTGQAFSGPGDSGGAVFVDRLLLGIVLGVSQDGQETYVVPFRNGVLRFVNLLLV